MIEIVYLGIMFKFTKRKDLYCRDQLKILYDNSVS